MEQIRATVAETTQRYFTCRRCGARGEVEFRAFGDSGWQQGGLLLDADPQDAHAAADDDLRTDAERVCHLIKCPTCKQRDPRYVRWSRIRVLAWFAGGCIPLVVGGIYGLVATGVFGVLGCWQVYAEVSRFRRADAARILRLKPGTRPALPEVPAPKPVLPPPPQLPRARAITAPPLQPIAPRGPDEEPAFLRK